MPVPTLRSHSAACLLPPLLPGLLSLALSLSVCVRTLREEGAGPQARSSTCAACPARLPSTGPGGPGVC